MEKKFFTNIKDISDDDKVYRGATFLFFSTPKGLECGVFIPDDGLTYILASNGFLVCLSIGEEGNITCQLDFGEKPYAIGKEIKRMLLCDLHDVYISPKMKYSIELNEYMLNQPFTLT